MLDKTAITTELEKLEDNSDKVTVTVSAEEVGKRVAKGYKDAAKKYRFPGFRPGHAPRSIIDNALGAQSVIADATENLLNDTYLVAIDMAGLKSLEEPKVDAKDLMVEGQPYVYSVTVAVKPEYELDSYDPVRIETVSTEATDEDIEQQLDVLKSYQYDFEEVTGRAVQDADFLILDMHAISDGEEVSRFCNKERIWQLGNGLLPKAFDEQIVGMMPGDEPKSFTLTPEDGIDGDKPIDFTVGVVKIREKVFAELDDEFAKKCGADDLADLRKRIADSITEQKANAASQIREQRITDALGERLQGEVPENLIAFHRQDILQRFFQQLQQNNVSFDLYLAQMGITPDQFKADVEEQAKETAVQALALDAIARHDGITVSDDEIRDEFLGLTGGDEKRTKELLEDFSDNGRLTELREALLRAKVMTSLVETVVEEDAPAKKPAKKASAKKTPAKKAAAEKAADGAEADKPVAKKAPAKKAPAKKPAAAKTAGAEAVEESTAEKAPAKKPAAKKAPAKKPAADKAPEGENE